MDAEAGCKVYLSDSERYSLQWILKGLGIERRFRLIHCRQRKRLTHGVGVHW